MSSKEAVQVEETNKEIGEWGGWTWRHGGRAVHSWER